MKRIVSVLLVVCVLTSMISVGIVTSSASTISSSDDYYTYKESYIKNYCTYDCLVNEMRLPYRAFVETLDKDTAFQVELDAWKLATISPDSLATEITQTQQCKYYEAILIDLLVRNTQEESFIENVQSFKDSIHVSAWKKYVDYNSNILIDTPITSENADAILKEIKSMGNFGKALEYADTISDYIDYAVDISDLFDKLSKLEMIAQMSESYAEVLNIMSSKCGNNVYLNTAIDNVALVFSKDLTVEQIKSIFIAKSAPYVVFEEFMKEVKKQVISYLGMAGLAIDLAQSVGTVVANSWFGTEDMINDYYEMSSLYEIEDLLRTAVLNTNGSTFCAAFKMYENICLMGCDYSKKYVEPLYTSLFGKLFAWATNQNYENYSAQLDDLKEQLSFMFEMIDVGADSWYVIDTGNTENMNAVNESFTIIQYTKEDYNNQNEDIKLDTYSTYGSNRGYDITLTKDMVINNNFVATGGTIDLNGHTLTINGNLLQPSGQMYIDGGTLEVNGDYRIQSYEKNSVTDEMEYTNSSGYLNMSKANDFVKINGSFYTQSICGETDRIYSQPRNLLSAGTMEISGDFKQITGVDAGNYYAKTSNNFACKDTHTVILNGNNIQTVHFDNTNSYFNNLKLIKDKEKGYIFDQDNCWNKLYLNTNVESVVLTSTKNSLKQGESMQLVSNVMGINLPSQEVIWTISGNTDSNTTISDKGILSVSLNEKAKQITVTVTSVADNTKSASLTITIEEIVPVINGIAITPSVASTACGQSCQFNAVVFGFYNPSQSVIWSISGNKSSNTKIDSNGLLTISNNETSKQITVKAVSSADKTITASVTVDIMQIKITSTVDNVTVTMETGETQHLKAVVTGTNNPSQNVVWSVSGNNSENTVISDSGEITIGKDETSALIIVKAVSAEDSSKYGEFAISVKQNILIGDTNGDGNVTIADATELQKHLANIIDFDDEQLLSLIHISEPTRH